MKQGWTECGAIPPTGAVQLPQKQLQKQGYEHTHLGPGQEQLFPPPKVCCSFLVVQQASI